MALLRPGGGSGPQLSQAPHRSGWLGWLPVSALEDSLTKWSLGDSEAREAVEQEEEAGDPEDEGARYGDLPLVFCCPRHAGAGGVKMEMIAQVVRTSLSHILHPHSYQYFQCKECPLSELLSTLSTTGACASG